MLAGGIGAAGIQCIFIREFLGIFHGNELVIGLILGLWLLCSGIGSRSARAHHKKSIEFIVLLLVVSALYGCISIRGVRLLSGPGEMLSPLTITAFIVLTQSPFAFFSGYLFGTISLSTPRRGVYGIENAGNMAGSLIVFGGVLSFIPNALLLVVCLLPYIFTISTRRLFLGISLVACALFLFIDPQSRNWKYQSEPDVVRYGHQGEIAFIISGTDTSLLVNNHLYRSNIVLPSIEQSVHIPLSFLPHAKRVLLVHDRHHRRELTKYPGLEIDCIESEPLLADSGMVTGTVSRYCCEKKYDCILLATDIPYNAGSNRYFTRSFYTRCKKMMSDSSLLSVTLSFNTNYMSASSRQLFTTVYTTLDTMFSDLFVYPGNGYTFTASTFALKESISISVPTRYLEHYILSAVTPQRIREVNAISDTSAINTVQKPIALTLSAQRWLEHFPLSAFFLALLGAFFVAAAFLLLPKNRTSLSISTSGFTTGAFSVALMLLYQSYYGNLYSYISLLMLALTLGFVIGSRLRMRTHGDIFIALYSAAALLFLLSLSFPPVWLFFILHTGIGILSAAQFVSLEGSNTHHCYAADLFGGIFGMSLTSVVFIPLLGTAYFALCLAILKGLVWAGFVARTFVSAKISS